MCALVVQCETRRQSETSPKDNALELPPRVLERVRRVDPCRGWLRGSSARKPPQSLKPPPPSMRPLYPPRNDHKELGVREKIRRTVTSMARLSPTKILTDPRDRHMPFLSSRMSARSFCADDRERATLSITTFSASAFFSLLALPPDQQCSVDSRHARSCGRALWGRYLHRPWPRPRAPPLSPHCARAHHHSRGQPPRRPRRSRSACAPRPAGPHLLVGPSFRHRTSRQSGDWRRSRRRYVTTRPRRVVRSCSVSRTLLRSGTT
jgi:hypothetical protein